MHFTAQLAVRFEKAFLEDLFYRLLTRTLGLHWPAFPRSSAIFREARETRKKPQKAKKERRKNKDNSGSTRHAFMELSNNAARCLLKHAGYECVYQDCKTSEEQSKCKTQCAHHMLVKIFV